MLCEAAFWRPGVQRPSLEEFAKRPELANLLSNWGRPGDTALVAVEARTCIGAAWYRFWTDDEHSYGYLGPRIPELGLAVVSEHRSKGVGRALLKALVREAQEQDVEALSLSVDPENDARRLYESEGFTRAGESGTSWTFILPLDRGSAPSAA
jgi:ribosomal protein S18 acetylase RimI-like enzyme